MTVPQPRFPVPDRPIPAEQLGCVHFIGVGGAGMSGIARILLERGVVVSGSDAKDSATLAGLAAAGAKVHVGHDPAHVADADTVVVSTAVRDSNPELVTAQERGLLVLPRAAALASVMAGRRGVCVAGTHGKTTTTSMLTVALQHGGMEPSFAIGGDLLDSGVNAHDGTGELFVAEADESDGSFLLLSPDVAVVTNVEPDHLDHYRDAASIDTAFQLFVERLPTAGLLVACWDDPGAARLADWARHRGTDVQTYGESPGADVWLGEVELSGARAAFLPVRSGEPLGRIELRVPGRHNVLNAAAALTACLGLGVPVDRVRAGLLAFGGTRRRFEFKGEAHGVRVYDSYDHHPTELRAVLTAARSAAGSSGRLVVAFQPHRYSRTAAFAADFGAALALADEVLVMDVYSAGEDPIPGVTGAQISAAVPLPTERVRFEPVWSAVAGRLAALARPGDLVLTLGAGDVTLMADEVLDLLRTGQR